jgi:hypothetical protein
MPTTNDSSSSVSNVILGKILHKESGNGIADLLVELFDLDNWADPEGADTTTIARENSGVARDATAPLAGADVAALYKTADRLGSVITNSAGSFVLEVTSKDFNLARKVEQKPDLLLLVLAPDEPGFDLNKRVLHFTRDIYFNAGSKEAYIIRLPTALLKEKDIPFGASSPPESAQSKVKQYVDERTREQEFNAGVAAYHGGEVAQEKQARSAFRTNLIKKLGTDFSVATLTGVLAADGDDIRDKNNQTLTSGIVKANDALGSANARGVRVNLYLTPADLQDLQPFFQNASGGFAEIPEANARHLLFRTNGSENPGTLLAVC